MGKRKILSRTWHRFFGAPTWRFCGRDTNLRVLCFHRIGTPDEACLTDPSVYDLDIESFRQQMRWITKYATPICMQQLLDAMNDHIRLPPRATLVTFDDGYQDNYVAAQILAELNLSATFFVSPGLMESRQSGWWDRLHYAIAATKIKTYTWRSQVFHLPDHAGLLYSSLVRAMKVESAIYTSDLVARVEEELGQKMPAELQDKSLLTTTQLNDMSRRLGMTIGSHAMTHRVLATLTAAEQVWEIKDSKRLLEQWTGQPIKTFAYPVGAGESFSNATETYVAEAGYEAAFSLRSSVAALNPEMRYRVPRFSSQQDWRLNTATIAYPGFFDVRGAHI